MPIEPDGPAPYAPPKATNTVLEHHRDRGLPTPITREAIARVIDSDPLAPRVIKTLRLFDLIDVEGKPTSTFDEIAKSRTNAEYKERLADVLRAAYADVFQYIDPSDSDTWKSTPSRVQQSLQVWGRGGGVRRYVRGEAGRA